MITRVTTAYLPASDDIPTGKATLHQAFPVGQFHLQVIHEAAEQIRK